MKVNCPACAGLLYETHVISTDGSQSTIGAPPKLQGDGADKFIVCPNCSAKVVMARYDTAASIGFRPSHVKT
jgi:DNA-directed RNA polymerase subunit RPC12/RpoP